MTELTVNNLLLWLRQFQKCGIISQKKTKKHATCKKCFKNIKYCGNTSNLHKHTKYHGIVQAQFVLKTNEKKDSKNDVEVDNNNNDNVSR